MKIQKRPRVCRTMCSHLVEVRAGLDLAGSLVPLEVLREVIRDGVLGAPTKQTLRLRKEIITCVVRGGAPRLYTGQ